MNTQPHATTEHLTTSECWALLREAIVGRLAVVLDDQPEIFPVNHVVDRGTIVVRTGAGTKLEAGAGRLVAYEVDGYELGTTSAWSVVAKGRAAEVTRLHDVLDVMGLPLFPRHAAPKPHFLRIEPHVVTGRRFTVPSGVVSPRRP